MTTLNTADRPLAVPLTAADASQALTSADLEPLLKAFNDVTARLTSTHESLQREVAQLKQELSDANQQVQRSRHLAMLGEMAAGIAHEVRNPLGSILLYARQLQEDLADRPGQATTATKIASAVSRLDAIVRDVLTFSRETRISEGRLCAGEVLASAAEAARGSGPEWESLTLTGPGPDADRLAIKGDAGLLHQALVNVIRNAAEAMHATSTPRESRQIVLAARKRRVAASTNASDAAAPARRDMIALTIRDFGPGITPDVAARMFNPFFTTRAVGTGLGLAIVHRIIDAHQGRVTVTNVNPKDGPGAIVEILLPVA